MRSLQVFVLPVLLSGISQPARADLFGAKTSVFIDPLMFQPDHGFQFPPGCSDAGTTIASCGVDFFAPLNIGEPYPLTGEVQGSVSALADNGAVEYAPRIASLDEIIARLDVGANADFYDTLSILGYSGSGFVQYLVSPTVFEICHFDPSCAGEVSLNGDVVYEANSATLGPPFTVTFPFTRGTFGFDLHMQVTERFGTLLGADGDESGGSATVGIDQILLFDSHMHPITNFRLVSASGTDYVAAGEVSGEVPEPRSVFLLLSDGLGCAGVGRKVLFRHRT